MTTTESERLFELFCDRAGLSLSRIKPAKMAGRPRPDYKLRVGRCRAIVEVKELGANSYDKAFFNDLNKHGRATRGGQPGRWRPKLREANSQVRPWAKRGVPAIVILYDPMPFQFHTSPFNVKSALFGQLGLSFSLRPDGSADLEPTETSLEDRVVTRTANTSISAVATLRWEYPERLELVLYHNPFARNPLTRGAAQTVGIEERWFEVI